ncbi:MAG: nucleotidyl transferase AbiEii/AbiGii toxin family protein [Thermoproteota archaeon]
MEIGIKSKIIQVSRREGILFKLQYKGPLYTGKPITQGSLEIDLSKREKVFLKPEWKVGHSRYPEVRTLRALCLKKEELLSEKLRALVQRKQPRDLYDIWFLTALGIKARKDLVHKKLKVVGISDIEEGVLTKFSGKGYQEDLKNLIINPPSFQDVLNVVKEILSYLTE